MGHTSKEIHQFLYLRWYDTNKEIHQTLILISLFFYILYRKLVFLNKSINRQKKGALF